jgi:hypothetical protein
MEDILRNSVSLLRYLRNLSLRTETKQAARNRFLTTQQNYAISGAMMQREV